MSDFSWRAGLARQPLRWLVLPVRATICAAVALILFMDGADAYAFAGIPLQWIGFTLGLPLLVFYAGYRRLVGPPGTSIYLVLLGWLLINTVIESLGTDYAALIPSAATTSYPVFVVLRVYTFVAFAALLIVLYNLHREGESDLIASMIVWAGVLVTVYAFYVLAAQKLGLPQPSRLRYGTGIDGEQSGGEAGYFSHEGGSYLFRLIGSFREPSIMAVWLVTPFFVSLVGRRRRLRWPTWIIGFGLLGTGSLTTAISIPVGLLGAFLVTASFDRRTLGILLSLMLSIAFVVWLSDAVLNMLFAGHVSFIDQFLLRIELLADAGLLKSNRGYVFTNFLDSPFMLIGYGLGNAHIMYSKGSVIVSFLNIYFHAWFAGGAIGMSLLIAYLSAPLLLAISHRKAIVSDGTFWYLAAYIAWLVTFLVSVEAFCVMFTVPMAALLYKVGHGRGQVAQPT